MSDQLHAIENFARQHMTGGEIAHDDSRLLAILRDADMLEIFGAIGVLRGLTSKATLPDYNPANIRGETWELTARDFDVRFANGTGIGPTIVDQPNFQISCYDNLNTATARQIAQPLVAFMRWFLGQLVSEIDPTAS